jgi:mono/diheme cytochrome c family protein
MEEFMLKRLFFIALTAIFVTGTACSQSSASATTQVKKTPVTNGKQMYVSYCASCHGVDGRGAGPVAPSLKMPPTDLTLLSKNNNERFPDTHILAVLQNGTGIPSHGTAEMPVWGPILGKLDEANPDVEHLRISNLIRYLQTLQVK